MKFNLYGLVIAWKQEAHKKRKTCISAVWKVEWWWFYEEEQYQYPEDKEWCRNHPEDEQENL